jgi:hypothetical protein
MPYMTPPVTPEKRRDSANVKDTLSVVDENRQVGGSPNALARYLVTLSSGVVVNEQTLTLADFLDTDDILKNMGELDFDTKTKAGIINYAGRAIAAARMMVMSPPPNPKAYQTARERLMKILFSVSVRYSSSHALV